VFVAIGVLVFLAVLAAGPSTVAWRYDLDAYLWAAQRVVDQGTPYDPSMILDPAGLDPKGIYRYGPLLAVALIPALALPVDMAALAWAAAHLLALIAAAVILPVPRWVRAGVFGAVACSYPAIHDTLLGNVSLLVLLLSAVAWRFLDRPLSGVAIALGLTLRPNLALVAVAPVLRGRGRPLVPILATLAVLGAVTLPFVGIGSWLDYLTLLGRASVAPPGTNSVDLGMAVAGLGANESLAQVARLVGYGLAVAAVLLGLRRDRDAAFASAATATLLAAPVLWSHYLVLLAIPAALLALRVHPLFVLLPLAGWLPAPVIAVAVLTGTFLPLLTRAEAAETGWRPRRS
jgi:hypothetical protein